MALIIIIVINVVIFIFFFSFLLKKIYRVLKQREEENQAVQIKQASW